MQCFVDLSDEKIFQFNSLATFSGMHGVDAPGLVASPPAVI